MEIEIVGGAGETGMNNCLIIGGDLIVDIGGDPTDPSATAGYPDDELLDYLVKREVRLRKQGRQSVIAITHGHYDHWGRLPFFFRRLQEKGISLPTVIGSLFTIGLIRADIALMVTPEEEMANFLSYELREGQKIQLGALMLTAISVDHSSPGCYGYLIETHPETLEGKSFRIFVSGDFKAIPAKEFPRLKNVNLMFCDGTSITRERNISESEVAYTIEGIISTAPSDKKVFVGLISTNIERTANVIRAAYAKGRFPGIFAGSLHRHYEVAEALDPKHDLPRDFQQRTTRDAPLPVDVILTTGVWGQGFISAEELAAMSPEQREAATPKMSGLGRLANGIPIGQMFDKDLGEYTGGVAIQEGDIVLISGTVYDFMHRDIYPMLKQLADRGARVIVDESAPKQWPFARARISSGGHANRRTICEVIEAIHPQVLCPYYVDEERGEIMRAMAKGLCVDTRPIANGDRLVIDNIDQTLVPSFHRTREEIEAVSC